MTTWTRRVALGLVLVAAGGCEVSTGDGFPDSGLGGSSGSAGSGGSAGSAGSAGDGGSSGADVVDAGGGNGGSGNEFPAPTCEPEETDDLDECIACIKTECCTEWEACDDQSCYDEFQSVSSCMLDLEDPIEDDLFECSQLSAEAEDMTLQGNTNDLVLCVRENVQNDAGIDSGRCTLPCFGVDLLF